MDEVLRCVFHFNTFKLADTVLHLINVLIADFHYFDPRNTQ